MKKEELMKQYEELKGKGKEPEMIFPVYPHADRRDRNHCQSEC